MEALRRFRVGRSQVFMILKRLFARTLRFQRLAFAAVAQW